MREIKFRAWDKDFKEMTDDVTLYANGWTECFFYGEGDIKYPPQVAEDTLVIMQYTGLKDKNSKEICEGDEFKHNIQGYVAGFPREENHISAVVYENGAFWVGDYLLVDAIANDSEAEVIGNIYEHPHLLEG